MLKLNNYFEIKWLALAVTFTATVILCTHIPQEFMPSKLSQSGLDKIQHIVAYGTITFLFTLSLKSSPSMLSSLLVFFALLVIGIADEATQPLVNRQASFADLVANITGIAAVLLFQMIGKRRFSKTNTKTNHS